MFLVFLNLFCFLLSTVKINGLCNSENKHELLFWKRKKITLTTNILLEGCHCSKSPEPPLQQSEELVAEAHRKLLSLFRCHHFILYEHSYGQPTFLICLYTKMTSGSWEKSLSQRMKIFFSLKKCKGMVFGFQVYIQDFRYIYIYCLSWCLAYAAQ